MVDDFRRVILRDLESVRVEIAAYPDDASVWRAVPGMSNAAGTLALHLAGNLQHLLGAQFGATGYVRNREAEFARRDVPRTDVLAELDAARAAVETGFGRLRDEDLAKPFPVEVGGVRLRTGLALVHIVSHLTWHLGQIDSHRRVVTGQSGRIGAISVAALA